MDEKWTKGVWTTRGMRPQEVVNGTLVIHDAEPIECWPIKVTRNEKETG